MKKKETAIDLVLSRAKQTREHKVSWCGGFSIDNSILEFAQNKGIITYRDARALKKNANNIRKLERDFIKSVEEKFRPENAYIWSMCMTVGDPEDEPAIFPRSISENGLVYHRDEIRSLLREHPLLHAKNTAFKIEITEFAKLTDPIYTWIDQLFISGILEREIEDYQKLKETRKRRTRISRSLVTNFIDPKITEVITDEGEPPVLTTSERQTLQFLFWKQENMTIQEKHLKNLLLEGKKEKPNQNGFLIVFEDEEVIKTSYGPAQTAGYHYRELKDALKGLSEKNRKLILKTDKEELRISIPLIKRVEVEHRYSSDPEFKKYTVVYIDPKVIEIDQQYTSYPSNHFAILRTAPPKTRLTEIETAFFDFLYSEVSYDSKKKNIIKRMKYEFLKRLDINESFSKGKNLSKLADRVENVFTPKALGLGLLEDFKITTNGDSEEVYCFTIAPRSQIKHFQP